MRGFVELVAIAIVATGEVLDAVLCVVDGDAIEPRRELRFLAERIDRLEHRDEDFLCDVFCLGSISEHAIRDVEHAVAMQHEQLAKGALVAVAKATDERSFIVGHRLRSDPQHNRVEPQTP